MNAKSLVPLTSILLLTACATGITLTGGGAQVQHVSRTDIPVGCNLLGDVAIGIPPDAARPRTEDQLVILMRNKAAELGATHVIIDSKSQETAAAGEEYWRGRGVAYACPEDPGPDPLHESTGGGEAPAEDTEPAEESEAGGDDAVEDLLEE